MRGAGKKVLLAVLLGALGLAALARAQPPSGVVHPEGESEKTPLELGSELYASNCASCHGIDGRGVSPANPVAGAGNIKGIGPSLRGVGPAAPDFYLRTGRMPLSNPDEPPKRGRPVFDEREIRALVAYVSSFGKGMPIPHPQPSDHLAQGLEAFTEHCAGCHQVVGEGGYVTDARVPVLQHATARQIAEAVRIGPYLMPRFTDKAIDDRELDDIIAYVQASKKPEDRGGLGIGHIGPVPEGIVAWLIAAFALVGACAVIGRRIAR
jgi:ubiquinol-cytochrome c reductase cytochrome c subunit